MPIWDLQRSAAAFLPPSKLLIRPLSCPPSMHLVWLDDTLGPCLDAEDTVKSFSSQDFKSVARDWSSNAAENKPEAVSLIRTQH